MEINTSFNRLYDAYAEAKCRSEFGHGLTRSAEGSLATFRAVSKKQRNSLSSGQVKEVYREALAKASAVGNYDSVVDMVDAVGTTGLFDKTRLQNFERRAGQVARESETETPAERAADESTELGTDQAVPAVLRKTIGDRPVLGIAPINGVDGSDGWVWKVADMDDELQSFTFYDKHGRHVHWENVSGIEHDAEQMAMSEKDKELVAQHLYRRAEKGKNLDDYDFGDKGWRAGQGGFGEAGAFDEHDIPRQRRQKYVDRRDMPESEFREKYGHSKWDDGMKPAPDTNIDPPDFEGTDAGTRGGIQSGDDMINARTDRDSGERGKQTQSEGGRRLQEDDEPRTYNKREGGMNISVVGGEKP